MTWQKNEIRYDNEMMVKTNNSVQWRWFIVPKNVEQINDYLFVDTHKSIEKKIGMNEMKVNDSEMCVRWNKEAWSIPEISVLR